jgi:uncharacterized protein YdcH (DUF465 family)
MLVNKQESSVNHIYCCFRAALAEARLMTPKQASDQSHFRTLAEELRSIEQNIASLEHNQQIFHQQSGPQHDGGPNDCQWMHEKSAELDHRLRQIESNSSPEQEFQSMSTKRNARHRRTAGSRRIVRPEHQANFVSSSSQQKEKA